MSEVKNPQPVVDISKAPLPTKGTLRARHCLPLQLAKFVGFNLSMTKMVIRGHLGK
ncbi:hypothetical protein J2S49_000751 [Arcanobacterium wilhelmae]|uniref:Uncharacterized protein n=1 Tax=Arcanobacterium wilhelmae TaxID=1803177 RepID=A0ABT9NAD0_9ACTO|nr:hypothetical protein [Arcanobacterium wilhelmae]MDP9800675.1 hypothetical protein [Arcanobacterium wilhelmae]WFN90076.1 hypothetical protein P8A24_07755 [Arcanobacterium wilhelmae]